MHAIRVNLSGLRSWSSKLYFLAQFYALYFQKVVSAVSVPLAPAYKSRACVPLMGRLVIDFHVRQASPAGM